MWWICSDWRRFCWGNNLRRVASPNLSVCELITMLLERFLASLNHEQQQQRPANECVKGFNTSFYMWTEEKQWQNKMKLENPWTKQRHHQTKHWLANLFVIFYCLAASFWFPSIFAKLVVFSLQMERLQGWNGNEPATPLLGTLGWVLFCSVSCRRRTRCVCAYVQTKQAEEEITPAPKKHASGRPPVTPQSIQVRKHQDVSGKGRRKNKNSQKAWLLSNILFIFLFYTLFRK